MSHLRRKLTMKCASITASNIRWYTLAGGSTNSSAHALSRALARLLPPPAAIDFIARQIALYCSPVNDKTISHTNNQAMQLEQIFPECLHLLGRCFRLLFHYTRIRLLARGFVPIVYFLQIEIAGLRYIWKRSAHSNSRLQPPCHVTRLASIVRFARRASL